MAESLCIFCGKAADSQEDVIPEWAHPYVADAKPQPSKPGHIVVGRHRRGAKGADPDVTVEWINKTGMTPFRVRCVCATCNNGWMSDIEQDTKPILVPMMQDKPTTLDASEQEKLAIWLGLKAMVGQFCVMPEHADRKWARAFATKREPPTNWHIRIGRYTGTAPVTMNAKGIDAWVVHSLSPFPLKRPALIFTIQLQHFVGQIISVAQQTPVAVNRRYFTQIWPHPLLRPEGPAISHLGPQSWPPERGLDDSDLTKCSEDLAEPRE